MEKSLIVTGKTIDAATEIALERLGLDRDSVSVEVLTTPRNGFFGIGAVPAKIKVTYNTPDETPPSVLSSASRNIKPSQFEKLQAEKAAKEAAKEAAKQAREAAAKPAKSEKPQAPRAERKSDKPRPPRENRQPRAPRETQPAPKLPEPTPKLPERAPKPAVQLPPYQTPEAGSMEERIETYLNGLLQHMGSEAKAQAVKTGAETYHVELVGSGLGMLIGRRGETLDAIQHLTNYAVGRGENKHLRISVDAESYRAKREDSLERLAHKIAGKVLHNRRNWTMEPMNAYERHVIHSALQDYDGVSTYSIGTEPNRRVVVAYGNGKVAPKDK